MNIGYLLGITAGAVVWMGPTPPVGYLVAVGPAPLRFQAPPKKPEEIVPLPPLAMSDPVPPEQLIGPLPPTNAVPAEVNVNVEPVVPPVAPVAPVAEPVPMFTPQMLIQYFNERRGTNGGDYSVVMPYQFSPPPANIPAPPSRATYIIK